MWPNKLLGLFLSIITFVLPLSPGRATEPVEIVYDAAQIETSAVNTSGKRNDASSTETFRAGNDYYFDQASFKTNSIKLEDASEHRCYTTFSDYIEVIPGISFPKTATLNSFVVSVGGIFNINKRGRLICRSAGKKLPIDETLAPKRSDKGLGNAKASVQTLPIDISFEGSGKSLVTATVPIELIEATIADNLKKGIAAPQGFTITVFSAQFQDIVVGSTDFTFYTDVDVSGPVGARCEVRVRFAIPPAHIKSLTVQDVGTASNCKTGSFLGQLVGLPALLNNAIRDQILKSFRSALIGSNDSFEDWSKDDPELAEFLNRGYVQGAYCKWRQSRNAICFNIAWKGEAISKRETEMVAKAPIPLGPVDLPTVQDRLAKFRAIAQGAHLATTTSGVSFPSGFFPDGSIEDGDMAIFGGLLCSSGNIAGCQLMLDARSADGRFWRSPRRVGEVDDSGHASFSGDQMKGVLSFLDATSKWEILGQYLDYIKNNVTSVPSESLPLERGFSSCPTRAPNYTCLIGGSDWFVLRELAKKGGVSDRLPPGIDDIISRSGFSTDLLRWESQLTNNGYRLHLVAVNVYLLQRLGINDENVKVAAKILAARDPNNAFFQFLNLGADKRVENILESRCSLPITRKDFSDWQWQRADRDNSAARSMVWDCVFMYGLVSKR